MLKVDRKYVQALHSAVESIANQDIESAKETLLSTLHEAMRLEASTIPPYYVSAWSIQDADGYQNREIRELISSIAEEEMLHMMAVANITAATGTAPNLYTPEMVLHWGKDALPIGTDLVPPLAPFDFDILTKIFMEIEKPENPQHYVVIEPELKRERKIKHYSTIGEFYDALKVLIDKFPEDPFANGAEYAQINIKDDPRFANIDHAPIENFVVQSRKHAKELIDWIVDQGEGTTTDPMDGNGVPAHYYRFAEIYKGGRLVKDDNQPLGYAYDKRKYPIKCNFDKIYQFAPNPKMDQFPPDSRQYRGLKKFNEEYTQMFKFLQDFYNGDGVQNVIAAISTMNTMAGFVAPLLTSVPAVCPSFEWVPKNQMA